MQTEIAPHEQVIDVAKRTANDAHAFLAATLEATPEERLNWAPAPGARTPLRIAAHVTLANGFFASVLRGEPVTDENPGERDAEAESIFKTKEAALEGLRQSTEEVVKALDDMPADRVWGEFDLRFTKMPAVRFMMIPGIHMSGHTGQIDYIQTLYGDLEEYFPETM